MKLTVFLLFGALFQVSASVYSQNAKLDLNLKNADFEQVLIEIQKQSDFDFLYKTELLEGMSAVAIKVKKATIHEVLEQILPSHLEYEIYDKTVIIKERPEIEREKPVETSKVQDQEPVTGKVLDDEGEGLPNVNVLIKGTSTGTVSDIDGNFSLNVTDRNATLVFSSIGFQTQEVAMSGRTFLEVSMEVDVQALEEIVVIGYGQVKKSDLTGSVASVTEKELIAYPALSAVQSLQGRAAGVQVTNNNGEPGAPTKVRVRGGTSINASSDPIFVVDGFVGGTLPPPEDIASIEILKDASATAIYGSRGANGVILVTTKRGEQGKTRITLNASTSFQQEINRLDLLNTNQFIDYIQETNPDFSSMGANTDWQDEIFRNGAIQNVQVGVSGGSDNVKYYVSGTVFDQKGIVLGSDYARYSATSNIDIQATDYLKLGLNLFARRTNRNGVVTQEGSGGANGVGVISSAFKFEPDQGIFDDDGNYTIARLNDAHDNPAAILNEYTSENENDRLQGNFFAEVEIIDGLAFKTTLGISTENFRTGTYTPFSLAECPRRRRCRFYQLREEFFAAQ
ncbi:MAG: SusC/RagA family TonB-linked outer membrane protein [Bacteroidota bacterium]